MGRLRSFDSVDKVHRTNVASMQITYENDIDQTEDQRGILDYVANQTVCHGCWLFWRAEDGTIGLDQADELGAQAGDRGQGW